MGKKGNKLRKRNRKRKEAREKNKKFTFAEYVKAYKSHQDPVGAPGPKGGNKDA